MNLRVVLIFVFAALVLLVAAWPFIGQTEPTIDPSAFQPVVVPEPPQPLPIPDIGTSPVPPPNTPTLPSTVVSGGATGSCSDGQCEQSGGSTYRRFLWRRR